MYGNCYHIGMVKTTLYIPQPTQALLRELSGRSGKPQSVLIREALDIYLSQAARPKPTFLGTFGKGPKDGVTSSNVKKWARKERAKLLSK